MTWVSRSSRNAPEHAHQPIDCALDYGINFLDTAEMFSNTPLSAQTSGETERIIGRWLAQSRRHDVVVIATKAVGVGNQTP